MKVTFQIEGSPSVTIECNAGDNLLQVARMANVAIDAPCSTAPAASAVSSSLKASWIPSPAAIFPWRNMWRAGA